MKKILISGAQGVGKTRLANRILSAYREWSFEFDEIELFPLGRIKTEMVNQEEGGIRIFVATFQGTPPEKVKALFDETYHLS